MDDITELFDSGNCVDMITVDFLKAFDKILQNKLLFKLSKYGDTDKLLNWIREFLIGRSFNVCINSCASKLFNLCSSVLQGSKLGSLLFILFTNEITQIFNFARIKIYADDLTICTGINNDNDRIKLQNELDLFCEWCSKWGLIINIKKCKLMHFGHSNNCFQYKLNDTNLEISDCERILGVHIEHRLTFDNHIYISIRKARNLCYFILSNVYCHTADNSILIQLYKTYARPFLDYASAIYSPHFMNIIDAIESVIHHFTKDCSV